MSRRRAIIYGFSALTFCGLTGEFSGASADHGADFNGEQGIAHIPSSLVQNPPEPLSVFDYRDLAEKEVSPAHFGFLQTGVLDDETVKSNRRGYSKFGILPRRLVDVSSIDTSVRLFGESWSVPIFLSPAGSQRAFHPDGEIAVARAALARDALQVLSTAATASIEEVVKARERAVWFQLYTTSNFEVGEQIMRRTENAGASAIVLTVDMSGRGMVRETQLRSAAKDPNDCDVCHDRSAGLTDLLRRKPMFDGIDLERFASFDTSWMTWDYVRRLRDKTDRRLLLKGIVSPKDACMAADIGVDGIIVSNHGGRTEETLVSTIEMLPGVVEAVAGRIPVLIDGGVRRGTDVFKALALGATAVCIGRPYLWGLGARGQAGVEAVLSIMTAELRAIMGQAGVSKISDINSDYVISL